MLVKIKDTFLNKMFIKYFIIGIINTASDYLFYRILLNFMDYKIATVIAFILSMIIAFFLNSYFTFKIKPTLVKFLKYPVTNIFTLFFKFFGVIVLVEILSISEKNAGLIGSIMAIPFTFILMKYILVGKVENN